MIKMKIAFRCLALLCLCGSASLALAGTCQNIAVPAYFYPSSEWQAAIDNAPLPAGRSQVLIMNPNNGPGTAPDPNYAATVKKVHAAGAGFLVYGYVYTQYGKRSLKVVEQDIRKYYDWYSVDGIFIDETASAAYLVPYYQVLANYITTKKSGPNIMLNPGDYPDPAYLNINVPADATLVVNVFEDSYSNYLTAQVPAWAFSYPSSRFSHLVYSTPPAEMPNAVALSNKRNVGWLYVTDLGLPNPWLALPTYWQSFTAQVESACTE